MLSRNQAKFAVCVDRYRKLFPCVRQTSTPHLTCHWLRTCRGIAEISKAAIPSNDVSNFRDIYLATSSCQRWAFLATCDTPESSDATLRVIRIELEDGTRVVLFRVLIRITRVCAYRTLKITPFSRSPPGRRMRFPRDAKSLNSFRYRNFPDDALLHANSEHFPRARVFKDFTLDTTRWAGARGILPATAATRHDVRIATTYVIRIDLFLPVSRHVLATNRAKRGNPDGQLIPVTCMQHDS